MRLRPSGYLPLYSVVTTETYLGKIGRIFHLQVKFLTPPKSVSLRD